MKTLKFALLIFLFLPLISKAQLSDTAPIKQMPISGFSLCQTTLTSLKQANSDLKTVEIEEMDLGKKCIAQDSRFVPGTGFSTNRHQGIIFQKDPNSDFISKIRLTKRFKGNLPDGNHVDLSKLVLKDVFKLYPQLKERWGSRGCSDYYSISNDTISFYIKIDKTKIPQYPIDEPYYLDKPVEAIDFIMSCYTQKQVQPQFDLINKEEPVFFIDSIRVNGRVLQNYDPTEIASITVFRDSSAIKLMGPEAKHGLFYIETKEYARTRYWKYFCSKSSEYAKLIISPEADFNVQYILNKRVLTKDYEGDLAVINDKTFKGIRIVNKKQLLKEFRIKGKVYGVIIESGGPENSQKGNRKF